MIIKLLREDLLKARWQRSRFYCSLSSLSTIKSHSPCTVGPQAVWTGHVGFQLKWKAAYFIFSFQARAAPSLAFNAAFGFTFRPGRRVASFRDSSYAGGRPPRGPRAPSVLHPSFVSLVGGFLCCPDGKSFPGPGKGTGVGCLPRRDGKARGSWGTELLCKGLGPCGGAARQVEVMGPCILFLGFSFVKRGCSRVGWLREQRRKAHALSVTSGPRRAFLRLLCCRVGL